jgi:hypothetical protein
MCVYNLRIVYEKLHVTCTYNEYKNIVQLVGSEICVKNTKLKLYKNKVLGKL